MTPKDVLKAALRIIERQHTSTQLAVDADGRKVVALHPGAVAWSSVGALIKVAPSHAEPPAPQHTNAAWDAFLLLTEAAEQQGYPHTAAVDEAGREAALRMYWRALQLVEPETRRRRRAPAPGTGSSPRGAAA